ncbi:bifunctional enzyme CarRP-like protein [Paraphysoderma sedebokerense]|nr:bifunctional enzyme CarRP-like protein [Paraphysoderma sedebokerense]
MLTYMQVHLYYNLPTLFVLFLLTRPFINKFDVLKLSFLAFMAFTYTTPWDNYIVYKGAWGYCDTCVIGRVGWVPYEEYMFFIIQTLMSGLFASIIFQFGDLPTHHLVAAKQSEAIRFIPLTFFLAMGVWGWQNGIPGTPTFYLGSILWWIAPIISLQWAIAAHYIWRQRKRASFCIAVSTLYLCWIDTTALREGAWEIMGDATTGIMVNDYLPLEEAVFFFLTNVILICGFVAADRTLAIMKVTGALPVPSNASSFQVFMLFVKATLTDECQLDSTLLSDIKLSTELIRIGSKSFSLAAKLYPWDLRYDIHAMYGFCRVTDDIADNKHTSPERKRTQLTLIRKFIDDTYNQVPIAWSKHGRDFTSCQISAMRNFFRVANSVPKHAVHDLINGYEWDLEKKPTNDIKDLVQYSKYVASSVGEMCTYMMFHSVYGSDWQKQIKNSQNIVQHAIDMGVALQVINIARDIITDAKLDRVYVPPEFFPQKSSFSKSALLQRCRKGEITDKDNQILKECAHDLISLANTYAISGEKGIKMLPRLYRTPVRVALKVYTAIGDEIRKTPRYPERAYVNKFRQIKILIKTMYFAE